MNGEKSEESRQGIDEPAFFERLLALRPRFLTFLLALRKVARRTEVFAFNTQLTRLTPWLGPGRVGRSLELLSANVPDWSGGTRIGEEDTFE